MHKTVLLWIFKVTGQRCKWYLFLWRAALCGGARRYCDHRCCRRGHAAAVQSCWAIPRNAPTSWHVGTDPAPFFTCPQAVRLDVPSLSMCVVPALKPLAEMGPVCWDSWCCRERRWLSQPVAAETSSGGSVTLLRDIHTHPKILLLPNAAKHLFCFLMSSARGSNEG